MGGSARTVHMTDGKGKNLIRGKTQYPHWEENPGLHSHQSGCLTTRAPRHCQETKCIAEFKQSLIRPRLGTKCSAEIMQSMFRPRMRATCFVNNMQPSGDLAYRRDNADHATRSFIAVYMCNGHVWLFLHSHKWPCFQIIQKLCILLCCKKSAAKCCRNLYPYS